jgi:hypothetical protein
MSCNKELQRFNFSLACAAVITMHNDIVTTDIWTQPQRNQQRIYLIPIVNDPRISMHELKPKSHLDDVQLPEGRNEFQVAFGGYLQRRREVQFDDQGADRSQQIRGLRGHLHEGGPLAALAVQLERSRVLATTTNTPIVLFREAVEMTDIKRS